MAEPDKRRFLVVYDYGSGGVWAYVWARSTDEIQIRFRDLEVVDEEPEWMVGEEQALIAERMTFDIDAIKPSDWISTLVRSPD
jgi:hypothetical protein